VMTAASLLAGRWTQAAGPRWSVLAGCVIFAAGLLLTAASPWQAAADPGDDCPTRADRLPGRG
jgi:MFS family permease